MTQTQHDATSMNIFSVFASKYRLANELNASKYQRIVSKSSRDRRNLVSIGVIDDEPFQPKQNLENVGYKIFFLGDPNNIEAVKPHQIILCDIQGVGQALDSRRQGSFIIKEIKRNYPDKYVVAYSGGALTQSLIKDSSQTADAFLKKDVDIDTWTDKLDEIIQTLLDPYQVWMRQRHALIAKDVDTLSILKLEDAYTGSMLAQMPPDQTPLAKYIAKADLRDDVRAIVQSLIASTIFKLLVG